MGHADSTASHSILTQKVVTVVFVQQYHDLSWETENSAGVTGCRGNAMSRYAKQTCGDTNEFDKGLLGRMCPKTSKNCLLCLDVDSSSPTWCQLDERRQVNIAGALKMLGPSPDVPSFKAFSWRGRWWYTTGVSGTYLQTDKKVLPLFGHDTCRTPLEVPKPLQ